MKSTKYYASDYCVYSREPEGEAKGHIDYTARYNLRIAAWLDFLSHLNDVTEHIAPIFFRAGLNFVGSRNEAAGGCRGTRY